MAKGRLSDEEKAKLLAKYENLVAGGMTTANAAKKVGVPYITIRSWQKKAGGSKAAFPRKQIVASRQGKSGAITLETPGGYRIEGLSADDLVEVLKALR